MRFYSNDGGGVAFAIMKYWKSKKFFSDIKHDTKNSLRVTWPTSEFKKQFFISRNMIRKTKTFSICWSKFSMFVKILFVLTVWIRYGTINAEFVCQVLEK